jgi:cytochrome c2
VCLSCHTPEHSDTFQFEPYLRDVVGKGHGEARRTALGDGPTGRELRAAGLAKAGGACKK